MKGFFGDALGVEKSPIVNILHNYRTFSVEYQTLILEL